MHVLALLLALFSVRFWENHLPAAWSDGELTAFLIDSPWAQTAGPNPGAIVFLASAPLVQQAEAEQYRRARRKKPSLPEESDPDYAAFQREDGGKHIVLAVLLPNQLALADAVEYRRMEQESVLRIGRRRYQITGHFPPMSTNPYLRLVYPRQVQPGDKSLAFDLYLPGVTGNFKSAEFRLKELLVKGQAQY